MVNHRQLRLSLLWPRNEDPGLHPIDAKVPPPCALLCFGNIFVSQLSYNITSAVLYFSKADLQQVAPFARNFHSEIISRHCMFTPCPGIIRLTGVCMDTRLSKLFLFCGSGRYYYVQSPFKLHQNAVDPYQMRGYQCGSFSYRFNEFWWCLRGPTCKYDWSYSIWMWLSSMSIMTAMPVSAFQPPANTCDSLFSLPRCKGFYFRVSVSRRGHRVFALYTCTKSSILSTRKAVKRQTVVNHSYSIVRNNLAFVCKIPLLAY